MTSSTVAFCHLVRFLNGAGSYIPARDFQNFWANETYTYSGVVYAYAPFYLAGNAMSKGADISESSLVTIPNDLTVGIITEAVQQLWLVETAVCLVSTPSAPTPTPTFAITQTITSQIWAANSMSHQNDSVVLALTTPLTLTQSQIPRRVLTTSLVGPLPATGTIYAQ